MQFATFNLQFAIFSSLHAPCPSPGTAGIPATIRNRIVIAKYIATCKKPLIGSKSNDANDACCFDHQRNAQQNGQLKNLQALFLAVC